MAAKDLCIKIYQYVDILINVKCSKASLDIINGDIHISSEVKRTRKKNILNSIVMLIKLIEQMNSISEGWYLDAYTNTHTHSFTPSTCHCRDENSTVSNKSILKGHYKMSFHPKAEVVELSILCWRKPYKYQNMAALYDSINTNKRSKIKRICVHLPPQPDAFSAWFISSLFFASALNILSLFSFFMDSSDTFI